jgi:Transposase, Mutator family
MRRVSPSLLVREELDQPLRGGVEDKTNINSALVDVVTRLVIQQLLEAEQSDLLGGRGGDERRGADQRGWRNGYEPGRVCTAEGAFDVRVPQVRDAAEPYRSMYARGRSTPRRRGRLPGRHRGAVDLQVGGVGDH